MKNIFKIVVLVLFVLVTLISCSESKSSAPDPEGVISIVPSVLETTIDDTFLLSIEVKDITKLFACSFELQFDDDIIDFVPNSNVAGTFWDNTEVLTFSMKEDNKVSVSVGYFQTGNLNGKSGNGELISFSFNGKLIGSTDIVIKNLEMIDENGNEIPYFEKVTKIPTTITVK